MEKSLLQELRKKTNRQHQAKLRKLRERYRQLREVGFSAEEAQIASHYSDEAVQQLIAEREKENK